MDLDKYGWLIPVSVILAVIVFCIYMASNGGPVYKENADKWHD